MNTYLLKSHKLGYAFHLQTTADVLIVAIVNSADRQCVLKVYNF